jgi:hypothetical protein
MRPPTSAKLMMMAAASAAAALVAAGCGSSGGDNTPPAQPAPSAKAEDFPHPPSGANLQDLVARYAKGPNLAPSVSLLEPGLNRVGFALFDDARKQLGGAGVAVYAAHVDGSGVRGPFVARSESLIVKPQFESRTTSQDPLAAKSVYVADVRLPTKGKWVLLGVAKLDGRMVATSPAGVEVGHKGAEPPRVGELAPKVHTPTLTDVGGDAAKIDTRAPPAEDLLKTDLFDVLGKKPVVLVMATPQLCQSRVCGPVVDVAEQVKAGVGDSVAFIHQEIYKDNTVNKGFTSQVAAYRLPTEPWTFVIDKTGHIASRFEGAVSVGELERAVAKVRPQ